MRKLKIAWITGSNFFNVDEPLMRDLSRCFDITWIVFMSNREKEKDLLYKMFYAVGVKGEIIEYGRLRSFKTLFAYIRTINRLKKTLPDLYYIDYLGMPYFFPVIRLLGIKREKLVYACHDFIDHVNIKRRKLITYYKKFIFNTVGTVKLFSKTQYDLFRKKYTNVKSFFSPLCLQYYGKPTETKIDDGKVHFLFFGSIRENKGLDILILAANKLVEKYSGQFVISICGSCKNWSEYGKLIKNDECFNLVIRRIDNGEIPNLFTTSDYLVLPYRDVTQSGPLSIAYSYNIPVIASDHDGFKEFIKDGVTGLLFKDGNVDDLVHVMEDAILKRFNYNKMRELLKSYTDKYLTNDKIIEQYKNMFIKLLEYRNINE